MQMLSDPVTAFLLDRGDRPTGQVDRLGVGMLVRDVETDGDGSTEFEASTYGERWESYRTYDVVRTIRADHISSSVVLRW